MLKGDAEGNAYGPSTGVTLIVWRDTSWQPARTCLHAASRQLHANRQPSTVQEPARTYHVECLALQPLLVNADAGAGAEVAKSADAVRADCQTERRGEVCPCKQSAQCRRGGQNTCSTLMPHTALIGLLDNEHGQGS